MAEILDLDLPSGTVHAEATGPADGPLVLLVHGISANLRAFDAVVEDIARPGRRLVAVDLRGRGGSPDSGPGTYGLEAHARTMLELVDALGAERLDYVGWSLGAIIGLQTAALSPGRLRTLTLIDHSGAPADDAAIAVVRAGFARLDAVVPSPADYLARIRAVGVVDPWEPIWDRFYTYELGQVEGGWSPRTSRAACDEDLDLLSRPGASEQVRECLAAVTMPALLIRCERPIGDGGLVVPDDALAVATAAIGQLKVQPSERNHWTVMTDPAAIAAISDHLQA
jgi:3-oxoadipate enol-lactonase